ncbi:NAD-dependent protein deacetylase sirtuin-7 isoform X2 [Aethina tumida]|uniref:NAD-dependent protein deacetylase sirtuin-7 isoform X2 n=1 Tax=Aethina tumida TaxID=116153 RepID=UPI00214741E5|nr:NAD-dependent protein deacetylase sirtuin-7 isoform X2 [Aethina tumida]
MEYGTEINNIEDIECLEPDEFTAKRCRLARRQAVQSKKLCAKEERNASIKKVSLILQKPQEERSGEDLEVLRESKDVINEVQERWRKRDEAKRRLEEFEDPEDVLREKCQTLAQAIAQSQHLVIYTGAGISTAAKIPDYRGPNGIWTRLQKGEEIGDHDLTLAKPTYTHMALSELYRRKILKYVVSQNCDGLHLRSGLPRTALSEVHGNMYVEVCKSCKPHKVYWRLFDVTENTARYSHKTSRKCYLCNAALEDTIVHFGERGSLQWPLNWQGACKNAKSATTILCLGSSLKVLKKYPWLWQMDKPAKRRPNLYIVNLQWTPKDDCANVKIHGKCDRVMRIVMEMLGISVPTYDESKDPIYAHASTLQELELHTTTQPMLKQSADEKKLDQKHHTDSNGQVQNFSIKDCLSGNNDLNHPLTNSFSQNCDTSSNSSKAGKPSNQCLPNNVSVHTSSFTIDSILQSNGVHERHIPQEPLNNRFNAELSLLSYDLFRRQILGQYTDFLLYPYQTSFLYSGLHSIINPPTFFKEEEIDTKPIKQESDVKPACMFCNVHYESVVQQNRVQR